MSALEDKAFQKNAKNQIKPIPFEGLEKQTVRADASVTRRFKNARRNSADASFLRELKGKLQSLPLRQEGNCGEQSIGSLLSTHRRP